MARPDKQAAVAEIADRFRASNAAVLTEYRGLTVAQLTQLRKSLGTNATYAVVKNTLTEIAAREAGITAFEGRLAGPTAIAFVTGDPVETAKGLRDFAKTAPALVIKGGVLDGKKLSPAEVTKLADLESREVLLAKLAGAMKASMAGAAATFAALPTQMARLASALEAKRAAEGGTAGTAGADAAARRQADRARASGSATPPPAAPRRSTRPPALR